MGVVADIPVPRKEEQGLHPHSLVRGPTQIRDLYVTLVGDITSGNAGKRPGDVISAGIRDTISETARRSKPPVVLDLSRQFRGSEHQESQQAGVMDRVSRHLPGLARVNRSHRDRHRADRPEYMRLPYRWERQLKMLSGVKFLYLILKYML